VIRTLLAKVGAGIAILFVVVTLTFFLAHLIPGDPAQTILGNGATQQQLAQLRHQLGLDQSLWTQYLNSLDGLVHGSLGTSIITGQPVVQALGNAVPITLSLTLLGTVFVLVAGVGAGILSAVRGGLADRAVQGTAGVAMAVPNYWLAVFLVTIFSITIALLPATGYTDLNVNPGEWARGLILPVASISLAGAAAIARQTRGALIDTFTRDYVRTLRSLGTPTHVIVLKHGLRNASIPVITSIGLQFIGILGGAVIIEQVFALPGIGQLTLSAVTQHDIPMIQGVVIFMAVVVLAVNILTDVAYVVLNPKLRHQ
jgi:peptide/nickel transport system permease protein